MGCYYYKCHLIFDSAPKIEFVIGSLLCIFSTPVGLLNQNAGCTKYLIPLVKAGMLAFEKEDDRDCLAKVFSLDREVLSENLDMQGCL